jgi:hypothetical protein
MTVPVPGAVCPFCGLSTALPHDTQQTCIEALHAEIARMKELLDHVRLPGGEPHQRQAADPDREVP